MKTKLLLIMLCIGLMAAGAQGVVWDGAVSNDWSDPENWDPNGVPVAGNIVKIQSTTGTTECVFEDHDGLTDPLTGRQDVGAFYTANSNTLTIKSGRIRSTGGYAYLGDYSDTTINIEGGRFIKSGGARFYLGFHGLCTMNISAGRLVSNLGALVKIGNSAHGESKAQINMSGSGEIDFDYLTSFGAVTHSNIDIAPGWLGSIRFGLLGTVAVDKAQFEAWYATGQITYDGSNAAPFDAVFKVDGSTLTLAYNKNAQLIAPELGLEVSFETGTDLEWADPNDYTPTATALYLRADDPNFHLAGNTIDGEAATSPTATGLLAPLTTYYWRVDTTDPNIGGDPVAYTGLTWNFMTGAADPLILIGSDKAVADIDDIVTFVASDQYVNSYDWQIDTGSGFVSLGAPDANSLSVTMAGSGTEGIYRCVAAGTYGGEAISNEVALMLKRKIHHWTMDSGDFVGGVHQDTADETSFYSNADATPIDSSDVLFETGHIDDGSVIGGEPNRVSVAGTWNPMEYTNAFTITGWAKWNGPDAGTGRMQVFSKRTGWNNTSTGAMFSFGINTSGYVNVYRYPEGNSAILDTGNDNAAVGEWVFIAMTYDAAKTGDNDRLVLYMNGKTPGGTDQWDPYMTAIDADVVLGGLQPDATPAEGSIDDVRVYNYAMTGEEIADVSGLSTCLYGRPEMDLTGDCIVNLADFAEFAGSWLDSGLYPTP